MRCAVENLFAYWPSNDFQSDEPARLLDLFQKILSAETSNDLDLSSFTFEDVERLIRAFGEVANICLSDPREPADPANPLLNGYAVLRAVRALFKCAPTGGWDNYY